MSGVEDLYKGLPSQPHDPYFRLIQLHVDDATSSTPLSCSLLAFRLKDAPPYVALSYTWGPPDRECYPDEVEAKYTILVNDFSLDVHQSAFDALLQIRKRCQSAGKAQTRYFWIDAICINQNDNAEKSSQVNLMRPIYSNSVRVWVWLGPPNGIRMEEVSILIAKIAQASREVQGRMRARKQRLRQSVAVTNWGIATDQGRLFKKYNPPSWQSSEWVDLARFLERQWWSRIWVIQEISLPGKADMMCGKHILAWEDVRLCSTLMRLGLDTALGHQLQRHESNGMAAARVGTGLMTLDGIHALLRAHSDFKTSTYLVGRSEPTTKAAMLCTLLHLSRGWKSTKPVDQVYALLGLLDSGPLEFAPKDHRDDFSKDLNADYAKDIVEVFSLIAKIIVEYTRWLGYLTLVEDQADRKIDGLASWVPDLTSVPPLRAGMAINLVMYWPLNHITTQELAYGTPKVVGNALYCAGSKLGVVSQISEPLEEFCDGRTTFESGAGLILLSRPIYPFTGQQREDVLWQTLIGLGSIDPSIKQSLGKFWIRRLAEAALAYWDNPFAFFETLPQIDRLGQTVVDGSFPTHDKIRETLVSGKVNKSTRKLQGDIARSSGDFESIFRRMCRGRCLFLTDQGHIGIGHCSMRNGDALWFLAGGPTPFILRKVDGDPNAFVLVGHTYTHGFLDGILPSLKVKERIRLI